MQLHCQSMDCLILWARLFVGALRYWSLKSLPSPLTFLLLETTSSLSGILCTKPEAFIDEGPRGLNKILGFIYIHSVIWEKTSLVLCALSSYTLALGREGFSQTSENIGPYLEARWMGSISHSGNSLSHSQEVIPAPPPRADCWDLLLHETDWSQHAGHKTTENQLSYLYRARSAADINQYCSVNFSGALLIYE